MSFHYGIEYIPLYSDKTGKVQNENRFFKIWEWKNYRITAIHMQWFCETNSAIFFTWLQIAEWSASKM